MMYKYVLFLLVTSTLISFCASRNANPDIYAVEYHSYWPVFDKERDNIYLLEAKDTIYFYKDLTIYSKTGIYSDNKSNMQSFYSTMYVFRNGVSKGIIYYPKSFSRDLTTFYVDSFIKKQSYQAMPFEKAMADADSMFITKQDGRKRFKETYIHYDQPDETYSNADVFFYDKDLTNIPFSFSKRLDSIKKAKLVGYQAVYKAIPNSPYQALKKERVIDIGIRKIPVSNPELIMEYIKRYQKDASGDLPEPPKSQRIR